MKPQNTPSYIQYTIALGIVILLTVGCSATIETSQDAASNTPSLTVDEKEISARTMLEDNGGCELPCWWGITPGGTTLQTLQEKFGPYKTVFPLSFGTVLYDGPYFEILNSESQQDYHFNLAFTEEDGVIQLVEVRGQAYTHTPYGLFAQDWQRYSIDQILARYGVPSHVKVSFSPPSEPGAPPGYTMTIAYEDSGFWIRYHGSATYDGTLVRVCPAFTAVNYIVFHLQSREFKTTVFWPDLGGYERTLEEATGMSLNTFYDDFKDASDQSCLESPPTLP